MDKDILIGMIKDQEEVIKKAKEQLEKLYTIARQNGVFIESSQNSSISFKNEIEMRRKEIMENAEKIRKQAMEQANQAISQYGNKMPNMMGNIGNMPQQDVSELIKKLKEEK